VSIIHFCGRPSTPIRSTTKMRPAAARRMVKHDRPYVSIIHFCGRPSTPIRSTTKMRPAAARRHREATDARAPWCQAHFRPAALVPGTFFKKTWILVWPTAFRG